MLVQNYNVKCYLKTVALSLYQLILLCTQTAVQYVICILTQRDNALHDFKGCDTCSLEYLSLMPFKRYKHKLSVPHWLNVLSLNRASR